MSCRPDGEAPHVDGTRELVTHGGPFPVKDHTAHSPGSVGQAVSGARLGQPGHPVSARRAVHQCRPPPPVDAAGQVSQTPHVSANSCSSSQMFHDLKT